MKKRFVLVLLVAALLVSGCGSGSKQNGSSNTSSNSTPTSTGSGPTPTSAAPVTLRPVQVVQSGASFFTNRVSQPLVSMGVVLRNPNADFTALSVSFQVQFFDDSGRVVRTETKNLPYVLPGDLATFGETKAVEDGATRIAVTGATNTWVKTSTSAKLFVDSVKMSTVFETTISGTAHSDLKTKLTDPIAVALLIDKNDQIVGGVSESTTSIPANGSARVSASMPVLPPNTERATMSVRATSLSALVATK